MLQDLADKSTWQQYTIQQLEQNLGQTLSIPERDGCIREIKLIEPNLGKAFWQANQSAPGINIILAGKVRLLDRKNNLIATLITGNSFGEMTLFPQESFYPYYAKASSQLKVGYLSREFLAQLMRQHPKIEEYLHQQAILQDLLLLSRQNSVFKSLTTYELTKTLSLLKAYKLESGKVPDSLLTTQKLWLLRTGELLNVGGEKLSAGSIFVPSSSSHNNLWQVTMPTELYILSHADWTVAQLNLPQLTDLPNSNGESLMSEQSLPVLAKEDHSVVLSPPAINSRSSQKRDQAYFPHPRQKIGHFLRRVTRRYPCFMQQSASDCGVACLINVGLYWGKRFNPNRLREIANVGRHGSSLRGLVIAAESIGFATRPVKANLNKLAEQKLPAIVHWEGNHYITVYEINRKSVIVVDPAIGQRSLSYAEFQAGWTGNALLCEPTVKFKDAQEARLDFWHFLGLVQPHKLVLLEILIISILIQLSGLLVPIFTQLLLDRVVVQQSIPTLNAVGLGLVIVSLFGVAMGGLRRYLLDHTANRINLALVVGFIRHTFRLPMSFFESRYVGDIMARVQENEKIQNFLTGDILSIFLDVLTAFIYVAMMFWYSWKLSMLVLVLVPLYFLLAFLYTPFLKQISREIFNAVAKEDSYLIEGLSGIRSVKSMAIEQAVRWHWEKLFNGFIKKQFAGQILSNQISIISSSITVVSRTVLLWFGAWLVIKGELSIGQLVALNMLLGSTIAPFQRMAGMWNQLQEVTISVERVNDVLTAKPEEDWENHNRQSLPSIRGHIRFEQVCFRYHSENEQNVLENLNFEILPGQTIALVGRSGSGKTTIAKLVLGLYQPTEGRVLIDGHDINNLTLRSLREQIGVVDQDMFLFGSTIQENISIRHPEATLAAVKEAAIQAGADEFIQQLPMGYATPIGEGGGNLSGGQRQRIAIARALLGNPRLLILDEATSNLDAESERIIQTNLNTILQGRTSIIIAHRLSTVRKADLILVLDKGILIESGTHEALMTQRGHYFYLNQQQLTVAG
ncbi:MAG: ABC transporter transmembrane domain-containing protein [Cyanobacteria bacterium P01_G01_bin.39]